MANEGHKYIFVLGGAMSGVGKGAVASSIGLLLQQKGYPVNLVKVDPYLNVDAGTMNPTEHGEVFVLRSGLETDQDMGNYERFLNRDLIQRQPRICHRNRRHHWRLPERAFHRGGARAENEASGGRALRDGVVSAGAGYHRRNENEADADGSARPELVRRPTGFPH